MLFSILFYKNKWDIYDLEMYTHLCLVKPFSGEPSPQPLVCLPGRVLFEEEGAFFKFFSCLRVRNGPKHFQNFLLTRHSMILSFSPFIPRIVPVKITDQHFTI